MRADLDVFNGRGQVLKSCESSSELREHCGAIRVLLSYESSLLENEATSLNFVVEIGLPEDVVFASSRDFVDHSGHT